ncbi:MAG TPA: hypothetical protein VMP03_11520 [Methylomirabilota bacterium]|nr:hypothetical protein [Methylomirabilota bacterium]
MSRGSRAAGLAFALVLAASAVSSAPPLADVADGLDDRSVLNPLAEVSLDSLGNFRDRPLFVPSRRPPPPPQAIVDPEPEEPQVLYEEPEPEEGPAETPTVTLSGILEIDSESVAMLRDQTEDTTLAVRVGDPVEAWTVAAIGNDSITLELDGEEHEIRIFQPGPSEDGYDARVLDPGAAAAGLPRGDDQGGRVREPIPQRVLQGGGFQTDPEVADEEDDADYSEEDADAEDFADEDFDDDDEAWDDEDYDDEELYGDEDDMPIDAADGG